MLINVLLYNFLKIKNLQSNVATQLRCDKIVNDYFIRQSMLSSNEKKLKNDKHLPKLWEIKFFFIKHGVYKSIITFAKV